MGRDPVGKLAKSRASIRKGLGALNTGKGTMKHLQKAACDASSGEIYTTSGLLGRALVYDWELHR